VFRVKGWVKRTYDRDFEFIKVYQASRGIGCGGNRRFRVESS
jgi:hypothetical protein